MKRSFIALFIVLEFCLLTGIYLLWQHNAQEVLDAKSRETLSAYTAITRAYGRVSQLMYDTLIQRPGIRELFRQGVQAEGSEQALLRGRLLRELYDDYASMTAYNLVQLHFHTPDGRSYLRFHKPEMSGDDLLASRPSIRRVLISGQPAQGFEVGKLFHGYRYVFPVHDDAGRLIGSVETSIDFLGITRSLAEVAPGHQFSLWLRRDRTLDRISDASALLYPLQLNTDYAIEDLQASLQHSAVSVRPDYQLDLEQRLQSRWVQQLIRKRMAAAETFVMPVHLGGLEFAAVSFLPIDDTQGQQSGYLVGYMPMPELYLLARSYLLLAAVASLLLVALLVFVQRQHRDSRALERERQMLKGITDNMLEGLFVQDAEGRMLYWNPALERILGFSTAQLRDSIAHRLIHAHDGHGDDLPIEQCPIRQTTLRGQTYYSEQEGFRTAAGMVLPVEVTCAPVLAKGRTAGSITVFRDMTQRLQMQQIQEQARQAAELNARMKSTFLANMSHEIRTPMNGVMGMLELVLGTPLNPEQREYLDIAQRSGEMLTALLNDILDVSKVDAGHLQLETVAFDLVEVIEHTAKLMAARAHQKQLELIIEIEPGTPRQVLGDPLRLRQVLINLLSNAVKFTEQGMVTLSVTRASGQPGALRFAVRDTGLGIDAEAQQHIFEAFRQADESTTRRYGGTGLGLSLSRRLVELMGSEIQLSSRLGEGSCFSFELCLPVQADQHDGLSASERAVAALAGLGVLIVDDILTNRLILERQVLAWGMRPYGFCAPDKALAWMENDGNAERVQLAVLDRMMPQMDGLELAGRLRALLPRLKMVMLSSASAPDELKALQHGLLAATLSKPCGPDALAYALVCAQRGEEQLPTSVPPRALRAAQLDGRRVLLAEDQPTNRMLANRLLSRHGVSIAEAKDGAQALARIEAGERFDCILMDCQMPVMDGPTATREIRRLEAQRQLSRTPILAITAYAGSEELAGFRSAGMDEVLSKPYTSQQLVAALSALLGEAPGAADDDLPLLDLNMLGALEAALGDDLPPVVDFFCSSLPEQIASLQAALDSGDHAEIHRRAHALKGSAGNIGALPLSSLARDIEQQARQQQTLPAELRERVAPLVASTLQALHERYPLPA